ncbi:NACHT domain-containing protein [Rhizobium laguerreae]|uniref:NACHT domain-containing protein n=1 Tax=Rhizobium laguerreae TaxID=1076926 RepID=UPI00103B5B5D|nr:hypothetical protein [Rhizobium laguerreae]TBX98426.1 hypothetical protein E0J21_35025 [Rhizobium laguerreae]
MPIPLNIDSLVSQLSPYMMEALPDIATNITSKGIEVTAAATAGGLRSLGKSISQRFRQARASSKAHSSFERNWAEALAPSQREQAIRDLLNEDPRFAASLDMLLLRRDFVVAMASYCNSLPALDDDLFLSDVYVPLSIRSMAGAVFSAETLAKSEITLAGNHILEGSAGSGKSTLLRHLARAEAQALLQDKHDIAFDELRLPCLIRAEDLAVSHDIATALHYAMTSSLAGRLRQPLPSDFFAANAVNGHRNWLVFVDGVDEVDGRQRREIWDVIRLHAERDSTFRFIVGTRSEGITSAPVGEAFACWKIDPIDAARQEVFAASYIAAPDSRSKFTKLLAQHEFRYVAENPLFLAMSAQIFSRTGEIYKRKIDLYEHYLTFVLTKAAGPDDDRITALSHLLSLVAKGLDTPNDLVRRHASSVQILTGSLSTLAAEEALSRLFDRTGLIRRKTNKLRFSHDSFRSYFRAIDLVNQHAPGPQILREIEPYREGWTVIEHLLLSWNRDGRNVEPALRSLLEFGDEGLQCAAAVIAAGGDGYDRLACSIAERVLRETKETGPTIIGQHILTILAQGNTAVQELLIEELYSNDFMSDTFVAECLLDTEGMDEALAHLLWVAKRHDGYSPDRVTAAELLLKRGYRDKALAALRDVAESGDEYWSMVDAASVLYEYERTPENRQMLADLCAINEDSAPDRIFPATLSRLMAIGEADLALPHLEAATRLPDESIRGAVSIDNAIKAARSIGIHHNRTVGKEILERMLASRHGVREKSQVASALADLGFQQEAKSALRSNLLGNEVQIDWFTVDLLIRLGLEEEARSAVQAAVPQLDIHKTISLIEHALPILDREATAALVLSRAQFLKEPRLARSLALLGAPEEARSLLSGLLHDRNIDLRIRAAGELCELGDARLGLHQLRAITRDKSIKALDRMSAAEQLKRVGLFRYAAIGFARVAQDLGVEVEQRTRAAIAFDELQHQRNEVVWRPLMEILTDRARPIADRVDAAEALIQIDGEDGYDDIVYSELFNILDDDQLSGKDTLHVGASLGEHGWTLDKMPRVRQVLTSAMGIASDKIRALRAIGGYGRNPEVAPFLLDVARHPDTSIELSLVAIDAISGFYDSPEVQAFLDQIVRDTTVPPAWRLKAAQERTANLFYLARDTSIDIGTRITALEALPKSSTAERINLLKNVTHMIGLTFWDRKKIAEAAHRLKMPDLVTSVLQAARDDRPLSVWEMVELAKLCRELGDESGADEVLRELLSVPLVILENNESLETAVEGIQLAAKLDRDLAISKLEKLLPSDAISWGLVANILEALVELVGKEAALAKAAPLVGKLRDALQTPTDGEYSGWPYQAGRLLKRGLFEDYKALTAFAENEGNSITERAEACVLVMCNADISSYAHKVARHTLSQFRQMDLPPKVRIAIIRELKYAGCSSEMDEWLDICLSHPPKELDDRGELANLLYSCGRLAEARALAENMHISVLMKSVMFPTNKGLIEDMLDEDSAAEMTFAQIMSNDDPFDQLWRAQECVEEHGDRRALKLIFDAANGYNDDAQVQLEAVDCLDQLGFHKLSRQLFAAIPKSDVEQHWLGAQLLRFGKKAEAMPFYIEAARSNFEYNENVIWGGLADLRLESELIASRSRHELNVRPN